MKHIEFIGIPASGKSTICDCVLSSMRERGYKIYHAREIEYVHLSRKFGIDFPSCSSTFNKLITKTFKILINNLHIRSEHLRMFFIKNPSLMKIILSQISDIDHPQFERELCSKWVYQTISNYEIAKNTLEAEEKILFDEGFAHRSNVLFEFSTELSEVDVREYISQIPIPDDVIILDVPIETAYERMVNRESGFPRFYMGLNRSLQLELLEKNYRIVETASEVLESQGSQIHRITNTKGIPAVCQELCGRL